LVNSNTLARSAHKLDPAAPLRSETRTIAARTSVLQCAKIRNDAGYGMAASIDSAPCSPKSEADPFAPEERL
jgi:hypothetical protein